LKNHQSEDRGDLLTRVLTGELGADSAEFQRAAEADPQLREQLTALLQVQADVDTAALCESVLGEAQRTTWAGGSERTRQAVREATEPAARRIWLRSPWTGLLAAAAVVLLILSTLRPEPKGPDLTAPQVFLGGELAGAFPAGQCDSYARFGWDHQLQPGWYYELTVRDGSDHPTSTPLAGPMKLDQSSWEANPGTTDHWPGRIVWELSIVQRGGGSVIGPFEVSAWR